jgi:hypothetical protein
MATGTGLRLERELGTAVGAGLNCGMGNGRQWVLLSILSLSGLSLMNSSLLDSSLLDSSLLDSSLQDSLTGAMPCYAMGLESKGPATVSG